MCYSGGAACSCASGEKSVGEGDEAHEEPGGALHRNRNVPPMEKRVVADKKTAHGELLDITPTMSSLIEVQCVTMEKQTADALVEKRVLAEERSVPMKRHRRRCTVACRRWRIVCWRTRRLHMKSRRTLRQR